MSYEIRCLACGARGWCRGTSEDDTNSFAVNDDDASEICSHIAEGGGYEGTGRVEYED